MANDFEEFARGDIIAGGESLAEITSGKVSMANGSGLVKTLRGGVRGSHKGTLVGTITVNEAVLKSGTRLNLTDLVARQKIVKLQAVLSDGLRVQVQGIVAEASYSMGESSNVTCDWGVTGQLKIL